MLALHLPDRYLDQLFVAPEHQGKGLGRQLLAFTRKTLPDEIWLRLRARERQGMALVTSARVLCSKSKRSSDDGIYDEVLPMEKQEPSDDETILGAAYALVSALC